MELDLTTPEGRKRQGELILRAIREAGLSVEQVAKDIGCSRALLYQYIAGTTLAQPDKLTLIARRTGKPLAYFYGADLRERPSVEAERAALEQERTEWERQQAEERERRLRERLETLLALADAQSTPPNWKAAASTCEQILPLARELGDERAEALTLFRLGNLRLLLGDLDGAVTALQQARTLFERLNDAPYAFACRQSIGRALLLMGRLEEAEREFTQAAQSEHWHNRWEAMVALAAVAEWKGDLQQAMSHLDEAERLSEQAPNERAAQIVRLFVAANRANVYLACGDFAEALKLAKVAGELAERLSDRDQQLENWLTQAVCLRHLGDWATAWALAERVRSLSEFADEAERVAVAETVLATIAAIVGDFDQAKERGKDALVMALRLHSRQGELWAHKVLAETYLRQGQPDDARYHVQAAAELAEGMRHAMEFAHALCLRAWMAWQQGHLTDAQRDAQRAFTLADEKGMRHLAGLAAWLQGQIACALSRDEEARRWGDEAERFAKETGDAELLWRCLAAKGERHWAKGESDLALAAWQEAMTMLESWRSRWREEGHEDTWLEDPLRQRICLLFARCLVQTHGQEAADAFIAQLGWLPLQEQWAMERGKR
ncbi:MAG: hypothetical protein OXFUSZZB_002774 [Candidatus Fervidibacter sp.]|jgi:tetratricopeptide (TPR) repeat protein